MNGLERDALYALRQLIGRGEKAPMDFLFGKGKQRLGILSQIEYDDAVAIHRVGGNRHHRGDAA